MKTRRTRLSLIYEGTDISQDVSADLESFEFTDNETGKADDIAVTLRDDHGLWSGPWYPSKGDTLQATIIDEGFGTLYCGRFQIDDLVYSGTPSTFQIKGVSVPLEQTIRRTAKTRAWEDVRLSRIATEISTIGSLSLIYDTPRDPRFDRVDQREESDLAFLQRLCEAEGYSLKVTDEQLVVFSQEEYEKKPPVRTITKGIDNITGWSLESQAYDLYSECECTYFDPVTEQTITRVVTDDNIVNGMKHKLLRRASNFAEAERWAKAELRKLNQHEVSGNITLAGDTQLISGVTIVIGGFGAYNGKYMVETAKHTVTTGYTTSLDIRRVLEDY